MLSCDKCLPLDTWNLSGSQENVFWQSTHYVRFITNTLSRNSSLYDTPSATGAVPVHVCTGTPFARGEERIGSTIPLPRFAGRPSTMNPFFASGYSTEFYGWTAKTANIGTWIWQIPHAFNVFMLEDTIKNQVTTCSDFPSEGILWIKEVETVDSVDDFNKPSRSIGQRESLLLWTRSPRILTSRRRSVSRNRKPKMMSDFHEEDRSLSWSTTTFESVLDYADLFSVTPRDDNVQEFDTRWDGISSSMTKIPSDDILESLYKLRIRESDPLKTV